MTTNPYSGAEPWDVSTGSMLPAGNHVVTIDEATDGTTSKNNPQIELRFSNDQGSIRDWLIYKKDLLGKVVALFDGAGIDRPQEGEFDPSTFRLTQSCIDRLLGKKVGIVIRPVRDFKDPTKMRPRVQGYVLPARVTEDIPADTSGLPPVPAAATSTHDEDIPFLYREAPLDFDLFRGHPNRELQEEL